MMKKKNYIVHYTINFESHDYLAEGYMHVEDGDYVYDEEGNEGIVKNSDDAMQFVINYYEGNGEDRMVDIPAFIWEHENMIGDTCCDIGEVETSS